MSLRGVRQLRELVIRYSDYDGSSKGIRTWMQNRLVAFAEANPNLTIRTQRIRCKHPVLTGFYINKNFKAIGVKNLEPDEIEQHVLHLRNQIGRKVREETKIYNCESFLRIIFISYFHNIRWFTDRSLNEHTKIRLKHCGPAYKVNGMNVWIFSRSPYILLASIDNMQKRCVTLLISLPL